MAKVLLIGASEASVTEDDTNLADLVAVERSLGVGGSGEKMVRKGGPLR